MVVCFPSKREHRFPPELCSGVGGSVILEKFMTFLYFQFFEALGGLGSCSLELRSMSGRNESFWDGLRLEI